MSSGKPFKDLIPPLIPEILDTLQEMTFTTATPVQGAVIPYFLSHKDVNASACTGSGKTLSFLIPMFQILAKSESCNKPGEIGGIIISPTRELALQTFSVAQKFEGHLPNIHVVLLTGGNEVADDLKQLQSDKCLIIIATPGRLKDIMERQGERFAVRNLEVLILDEADVLLDLGHTQTIGTIISKLPKQRRTGLFSATEADGVTALCRAGLRNPIKIKIEIKNRDRVQAVPVLLKNYYVTLPSDAKFGFLTRFFQVHSQQKIIVFFLTCASVDYFAAALQRVPCLKSLRILSLHGRMVQKKRTRTMETFRQPSPSILICTDVAARGIDVPDIDWIIQYAPPQDPAFFVHRVGRTARAGKQGQSVLLLEPSESAYIPFTQKRGVPLLPLPSSSLLPSLSPSSSSSSSEHAEKEEEELIGKKGDLGRVIGEESIQYLKTLQMDCSKDRDLYEKSVTAFVADIRAYRNHDCNFILRFEDLNLATLARSFALVRLPRMSELKNKTVDYEELDIELNSIPYVDPVREKARQERMKKEEEARKAKQARESEKKGKQDARKSQKRDHEDEKKKKKGKHERMMDEWDELQEEERLYKLFKKKKVSLIIAKRCTKQVIHSEEEYEKHLLSTEQADDNDLDEKGWMEKVSKDHQMMRNARKSKKSRNTKSRHSSSK